MNAGQTPSAVPVILSERNRFGRPREAVLSAEVRGAVASAEVLRAHRSARIFTALVLALLELGLFHSVVGQGGLDSTVVGVLATAFGYVAVVSFVHIAIVRRGMASPWLVTLVLVVDLAFIHLLTWYAASPSHYERALFGTIVVVHVANFFFGRRQTWRVVQLGVAAYVVLIATAVSQGLAVDVAEEVWTLAMCAAGISLIVLQAGDVRRRLRTLVRLFEHAEQGDFAHEYDVVADGRPDAITRVGLAYNAVRRQLANMVLTDPLTGCLNRRGFDQALSREVGRATRSGNEFALLALDLDHFKEVNDTYGHLAGDDVLRVIGELLLKAGRAGDVVARAGGEEFAILLADTGASGAELFAQRLCERIGRHEFSIGSSREPVSVTASIGVAVGCPRGISDFAECLWSRADDALYAAKRSGRNCVRSWTTETRNSGGHGAVACAASETNAIAS